jgi:hypothetical protein
MADNANTIYDKLLAIQKMAGVLQKNKEGFNYKYASEDEVLAKITAGMQQYNLALIPSIVPNTLKITNIEYKKYNRKLKIEEPVNENIVSADMIYTWINCDNPEEKVAVPWVMTGQMADSSQAFGGALTYCNRYFLLKSFQIATVDDDPDSYRSKQKKAAEYEKEELLKEKKNESLELMKQKINEGFTKDVLFKMYSGVTGTKNPNSINDIETLEKGIEFLKKIEKEESNE